ncbi:MAG: hypothetical protein Q7K03_08685 [Dehalococcoidia bacterium]|nr:hypothetical protein [Dehalococcoidia bacterium]
MNLRLGNATSSSLGLRWASEAVDAIVAVGVAVASAVGVGAIVAVGVAVASAVGDGAMVGVVPPIWND